MNGITRSMEATGARAAAGVEARRRSMPSGWWGAALLIATEVALFGSLIATYFYLRFQSSPWPPAGIDKPSVVLPLVFTGMLAASAAPMFAAFRAASRGRRWPAWWLLLAALAIQATYLGLQIHLFVDDFNRFGPSGSTYGSVYFTLLGLDHAHVAVGLALDVWLIGKLLGGLTNYRLTAVRVAALYWYFVVLLTITVTLTVLYPSL